MKQEQRSITLTFTDYQQHPDPGADEERCLRASNGSWITVEEMEDAYLAPAFRQLFARIQPGETLRITVEIQSP